MKAEYVDERDTSSHNPNSPLPPTMFSKFHQPKFQAQHQPPEPPPPLHHPQPHYHHLQPAPAPPHGYHNFHFAKESQTSEEADSSAATAPATTTAAAAPTPPAKKSKSAAGADDGGETIEVARRPRGRPPGSKNKPKPPMVVTREPDAPSMSPYILEIPAGADVVESLVRLARRRGIGLCVLSGSGAVANVSLRQPTTTLVSGPAGGGTITFHGRFELVSLSAVLLPGGTGLADSQQPSLSLPLLGGYNGNSAGSDNGGFTVSLSAPQGHIMGGKVAGPLTAAGTVYVVAASFNNPTFHKLPLVEEDGDGGEGGRHVGSPAMSGGGGSAGEASADGGGAMYSWAPMAARPAPY